MLPFRPSHGAFASLWRRIVRSCGRLVLASYRKPIAVLSISLVITLGGLWASFVPDVDGYDESLGGLCLCPDRV